jgi:hypothetical protein
MKTLWLFPMAFLAGDHGFAMIAPYLTFIVVLSTLNLHRRRSV